MLEALMLTGQIPEIRWVAEDDLCDCTFQRIGWWTNPYIGKTMEVRLCCAWAALADRFPEVAACIREIPAFDNYNTGQWETEPAEWNGEADMPRAIWYRHLAAKENRPLEEIRHDYEHLNAPKGVEKKDPARLVIAQHKTLQYFIVAKASEMEQLQQRRK